MMWNGQWCLVNGAVGNVSVWSNERCLVYSAVVGIQSSRRSMSSGRYLVYSAVGGL